MANGRGPLETLGLVSRGLEDGEHEGEKVRMIRAARTYETEIDDLWDALTNPERIPRWFLPITGELREGGRYQLQGNAGGTIRACERPTRLSLTWEYGGDVSWLEVRLREAGKARTQLELQHTARVEEVFSPPEEARAAATRTTAFYLGEGG